MFCNGIINTKTHTQKKKGVNDEKQQEGKGERSTDLKVIRVGGIVDFNAIVVDNERIADEQMGKVLGESFIKTCNNKVKKKKRGSQRVRGWKSHKETTKERRGKDLLTRGVERLWDQTGH